MFLIVKIPNLSAEEVSQRVLPALVTLAGDPDPTVKKTTVDAFGSVALLNIEDPSVHPILTIC